MLWCDYQIDNVHYLSLCLKLYLHHSLHFMTKVISFLYIHFELLRAVCLFYRGKGSKKGKKVSEPFQKDFGTLSLLRSFGTLSFHSMVRSFQRKVISFHKKVTSFHNMVSSFHDIVRSFHKVLKLKKTKHSEILLKSYLI